MHQLTDSERRYGYGDPIASSKWDLKLSGEQYKRWYTRIFGIGFLIYNFGLVRLVYGVLGLVSYHGPIILGTIC